MIHLSYEQQKRGIINAATGCRVVLYVFVARTYHPERKGATKMKKVIDLKEVKALKNPLLAICQQLENHNDCIMIFKKDIDFLVNSVGKDKEKIEHLINAVQVLIWSNIIAWITIFCIIFGLFRHTHSLAGLL